MTLEYVMFSVVIGQAIACGLLLLPILIEKLINKKGASP